MFEAWAVHVVGPGNRSHLHEFAPVSAVFLLETKGIRG